MLSNQALILFAHGARDPAWARPVEAIAAKLRAAHPECAIVVAFLEFLQPTLTDAVAVLHQQHPARPIDILPFFIAQGGHLRNELPIMLADLQPRYPSLSLRLLPPLGELPAIQNAIADAISVFMRRN